MLKGRTTEQKRRLVARITDAIVEEAKTPKEGVVVTIIEVERYAPVETWTSQDKVYG
jgi:4-oxalocrotonate tautomerase family enzyme